VLALVSNSVPVPFAAVGTPVQIGLGNISTDPVFLNSVAKYITSIDLMAGVFMPTIVVMMLIYFFGKNNTKKDYLEILPWTLFIGISYTVIAFIVARTLGYEFVTIVTVLLMLLISTVTIRFNFLVPKNKWQKAMDAKVEPTQTELSLLRAWLPYALVIVLLVLTRVIPSIKTFSLTYVNLSITNILGISNINSSLQLLYSPGFILIIAAVLSVWIQKAKKENIKTASLKSLKNVKGAALALIPTLAMVQIFSNSGINLGDLQSMPVYLATFLGEYLNGIWIFLAPFIGELGSFITGSATVSTLTFAPVQQEIATLYGLNVPLILSIQVMGGAAGNMICVHNVVSVSTVVGTEGLEGEIIKKTIIPAVVYGLLIGLSATILLLFVF